MTRLADVTGLDRLGVFVFQAIRPLGRALSVHQGKALAADAARIGALMEAIESDHAERFAGERRIAASVDLPAKERPRALDDFAENRAQAPGAEEGLAWTPARRLLDDSRLWVPFDCVSLDYTRAADARLDRSSNGLGARWDGNGAALAALLEVIERDAFWRWATLEEQARALSEIDGDTVPYSWWRALRERLDRNGMEAILYRAHPIVPVAALVCEIVEPLGAGERRRSLGAACRLAFEPALAAAVAEAAQARLTTIAGARDDILGEDPMLHPPGRPGAAFPLPPSLPALDWREVTAAEPPLAGSCAGDLAVALAGQGYPDAAIVDLSRRGEVVRVVKAFVPGLAAFARSPRLGV